MNNNLCVWLIICPAHSGGMVHAQEFQAGRAAYGAYAVKLEALAEAEKINRNFPGHTVVKFVPETK